MYNLNGQIDYQALQQRADALRADAIKQVVGGALHSTASRLANIAAIALAVTVAVRNRLRRNAKTSWFGAQ